MKSILRFVMFISLFVILFLIDIYLIENLFVQIFYSIMLIAFSTAMMVYLIIKIVEDLEE